ncbi:hypothetical protein [Hoeflea poritis]|uniref:Uncharacterized protein n=1 Tax=Hoeflea poritis TaxID=2993659 RepID=A0ABT4VVE1_9HYPH|nr:hypothetical protein [Hoeflea poritis]MDA4848675.1 hypothetical protein [Hoeflea poritis]
MTRLPQIKFPHSRDRPVRKVARSLRWFLEAFSSQVNGISSETGLHFDIDKQKLRTVFLTWVKLFEAQKPSEPKQKIGYITFSAAMMLSELIDGNPIRIIRKPENANTDIPLYYWPEGYVYVAFCMNVRSAVLAQDLNIDVDAAPPFDDIRTWWSFRENAREDSSTAIGFFELFVGDDPKWSGPKLFSPSHAETNTDRMLERAQKHLTD